MKKRLLSLALALCLSLGLAAPTPALALAYGEEYTGYDSAATQQYRDVPESHWAAQSIATCSQRTWFNGYPDGTFRPEGLITREEAAKVFAVAMGLEIQEDPEVTYTDTADNWARAYIEATKPLFPDATNLQGTASFRPTQTITREETIYALVVAWRYASKATNADLSVLNMFSDTNSISVGVKPYMAVAVSEGLVSGLPDGTIAAQKGLTRAEFATLLARALSHGYGPDSTQAPAITLDRYSSETTQGTMTLSGKVSPMASGTKLTLDGQSVTLDKNGAFSVKVELQKGNNSFTLAAVNAYGVKTSKTVTVKRADPEPSPTPTRQPEPTQTPEPTPSQTAKPSKEPEPSQEPEPSKDPEPAPSQEPKPTPSQDPKPSPSQEPEQKEDAAPEQWIDPDRTAVNAGKCGEDLYWILYEDGELEITGTGEMDHYGGWSWYDGNRPWEKYLDQITTVTIAEGVKAVGCYAFDSCKNLKQVTIPSSMRRIDGSAFSGTALESVTIPEGVEEIGWRAFNECKKLTSMHLPSTLEVVESFVFDGCKRLTNVYYADGPFQWADVEIDDSGNGNDLLRNADIQFYSAEK